MQLAEAAAEVAKLIIPALPTVHVTDHGKLKFDEKTYLYPTPNGGLYKRIEAALPLDIKGQILDKFKRMVLLFPTGEFDNFLQLELLRQLTPDISQSEDPNLDKAFFNSEISTPIKDLKLIYDLANPDNGFLYEPQFDFVHKISMRFIQSRMSRLLGKDSYESWAQSHTEDCYMEYTPFKPRIYLDTQNRCKKFNLWTEAPWKLDWIPDEKAKIPEVVDEFLNFLFPDKPSRDCALGWLRDATFGRALQALILCGKPGGGKNTFVEYLAANLVGVSNYRKSPRGFNRSSFHSAITSCRIFFQDEMSLHHDAREIMKDYLNAVATIERKGVDVGEIEKIHASIVVANNYETYLSLEYSDRKFQAPNVADSNLNIKGQPFIDTLLDTLKDPIALSNIASYLYFNYKQGQKKVTQTQRLLNLCINSFSDNFKRFIDTLKRGSFSDKQFNRRRKVVLDIHELQDSLRKYEAGTGNKICNLKVEGLDGWYAESLVCEKETMNGKGHTSEDLEIERLQNEKEDQLAL